MRGTLINYSENIFLIHILCEAIWSIMLRNVALENVLRQLRVANVGPLSSQQQLPSRHGFTTLRVGDGILIKAIESERISVNG